MRWYWIDRFTEFQSGRRAAAIKNVALDEEVVQYYLPGFPILSHALIIEGLAQTGGLLVAEHNQFRERVVLAKVGKATFYHLVEPGQTLTYTAIAEDIKPTGAICRCTSYLGDQLQADVELVFAHLDDRFAGVDLFPPADLLRMLRQWRLFEVARDSDGQPIPIPEWLLEAERTANAGYY